MPYLSALFIFIFGLAASLGYSWIWRPLLPGPGSVLRPLHALSLGLGTLAYLVLGVGLAGWLSPLTLGALLGVGCLLAPVVVLGWQRPAAEPETVGSRSAEAATEERSQVFLALLCSSFVGLLALVTLPTVFKPLDGLEWDSLSYHLAAPKIYLRDGRISLIAYDSHTDFPFTLQMLYTLGLQFGGVPGAKLFHWGMGWLTALAVGLWAARLEVDGRRAPAWVGPVAAAAFGSMPIVLWEIGTAYVDLGTALFQFLALAALLDGVQWVDGRCRVEPRAAALAGALSGFALGTKYTALLQFGLLGLGLLWLVTRAVGPDRPAAVRAVLSFGALGVLVASPWYVKNWLWVHNPVYPFFYRFFPRSFSWTTDAETAYAGEQRSFGMGRGPQTFVEAFWNLAVHGREFYSNQRTLVGDKLGSLGPVWAGLTPLLLWTRGLDWRAWACGAYTLGSLLLWWALSHQSRYLLPVFAPLAVLIAVGVAALVTRPLRIAAGLFLAAAFVLNLGMHVPLALNAAAVASGQVNREEYLRDNLPGLYEAAEWINQLPEDARIAMYQETRGFYFDRKYFWANPLQHNLIPYAELLQDQRRGDALADELKGFGITHVLINHDFTRGVERSDWYVLVQDAIQRGRLEEVWRSTGAELERRGTIVYQLR